MCRVWALLTLGLSSLTTALDVGAGWGRFGRALLERAEAQRYLVCADISLGCSAPANSSSLCRPAPRHTPPGEFPLTRREVRQELTRPKVNIKTAPGNSSDRR